MKFTLLIDTDYNDRSVKDECMAAVARVLEGKCKPYNVGYFVNEPSVEGKC